MRKLVLAGILGVGLQLSAAAEPFYGSLDEEVEAFLGSYVFVGWGSGMPTRDILSALERCDDPRPDAEAPAPYRTGDIAVYRLGDDIRIEGDRVVGGRDTLSVSNTVAELIDNFTFIGSHQTGTVELAHFHRDEGIWPGVWIKADGKLAGVYATCEAVRPRPVAQD